MLSATRQARRRAGATQERTLFAVACTRLYISLSIFHLFTPPTSPPLTFHVRAFGTTRLPLTALYHAFAERTQACPLAPLSHTQGDHT